MIKTLGDFIRERRDDLDMSLREFAKKLGDISPAHISDIENGRRYPSEELLEKMSHLLRVSVAEFHKHDSRPPVDELKRMVRRDPTYGMALRKLAETKINSEELLKFIEGKAKK
jgi:transcriptional regulator with XRE-family HTH domain